MDYDMFLHVNGIEDKTSSVMSFALLRAGGVDVNAHAIPAAQGAAPKVLLPRESIEEYELKARVWLVELVGSRQVGALKEKNFTSYFASKESEVLPWKVEDIIGYLSVKLPNLLKEVGYSELIESSTWLKYHTTAASTSGLVLRAKDAISLTGVFTAAELALVASAHSDLTDLSKQQKITVRTMVMTSAILEACGSLPENWYMGKRAVQEYNPAKYSALVKVFKKAQAIANLTEGVDSMTSMAELQGLFDKVNA